MTMYENYQTYDFNPYILLVHIRVWMSVTYEVVVEHYYY